MRGVGPWTYKDEIFSRFLVVPQDPHRTDLLMGEAPKTNQGKGSIQDVLPGLTKTVSHEDLFTVVWIIILHFLMMIIVAFY